VSPGLPKRDGGEHRAARRGRVGDTLLGMTRPELSRRVGRAEEDLTAVSDTVLDIKETVDRHTETLAVHGRELTVIRETQVQHGEVLAEILRRLDAR
jgi:hypothetical protein